MDTAAFDLYWFLIHHGFRLEAVGDRIDCKPASKLTQEMRESIRTHKDELLAILRLPIYGKLPRLSCPTCPGGRFWMGERGLTWLCASCRPPARPEDDRISIDVSGDDVILSFAIPVDDPPKDPSSTVDTPATLE